jgi:hypothetical protein
MRLFPLHIIIKDCSHLLFYFVIMRFNLTGETFLPEIIREFPEASKMTLSDMIVASIYFNVLPIAVSFLTYFLIYFSIKKLFVTTTVGSLLLTGFILTMTTPLCYILTGGYEPFELKASISSWVLTFVISIATYFWFNKKDRKETITAS